MFEIRKYWNNWDIAAVVAHFVGIAVVIWFFFFVWWFVLIKVVPLNMKKEVEMK